MLAHRNVGPADLAPTARRRNGRRKSHRNAGHGGSLSELGKRVALGSCGPVP